jgi:hypothetical protein
MVDITVDAEKVSQSIDRLVRASEAFDAVQSSAIEVGGAANAYTQEFHSTVHGIGQDLTALVQGTKVQLGVAALNIQKTVADLSVLDDAHVAALTKLISDAEAISASALPVPPSGSGSGSLPASQAPGAGAAGGGGR